jgi:hypothetical protein
MVTKDDFSDLPKPAKDDFSDLPSPRQRSRFPDIKPYETPSIPERLGATAYGAVTGLLGAPGELEKLAFKTAPEFAGIKEPGETRGLRQLAAEKMFGRETIFPTTKDIERYGEKVGVSPPREEVSGARMLGELGVGLLPMLPSAGRAIVGTPSKTSESAARRAEELGFKISPAQVRADQPIPMKGATGFAEQNQTRANQLASRGTGKQVNEIDETFLAERFKTLGKDFDNLYQGRVFNIDQPAINALRSIAQMETQLPGFAAVNPVKQEALTIINNYNSLASRLGSNPATFGIEGEALQRMRNALAQAARSSANRGNAREIYDIINVIDESVERNHPQIATALSELRPKYRNTVVLEDLYRKAGIRQGNISLEELGDMLATSNKQLVRRSGLDIDELGKLGRELRLRARWQPEGSTASAGEETGRALGTALIGRGADLASQLLRTRGSVARRAQKFYADRPKAGTNLTIPAGLATATVARPLQTEE